MQCSHCGAQQPEGAAFCDNCGAALGQMQAGTPDNVAPAGLPASDAVFPPAPPPTLMPPAAGPAPLPTLLDIMPNNTRCPSCGAPIASNAAFCDNCGASLGMSAASLYAPPPPPPAPVSLPGVPVSGGVASGMTTCPACGAQTSADSLFCDNCGASLTATPAAAQSPASAVSDVLKCAKCGALLEPDSKFCDYCGAPIQTGASAAPPIFGGVAPGVPMPGGGLNQGDSLWQPVGGAQPHSGVVHTQVLPSEWGGAAPMPETPLSYAPPPARLVVQGSNAPLPLPAGKMEWLVGRADPINGVFPDVDLTDYGGDDLGVSRRHARIYLQGAQFYIEDFQSMNHTHVNHQRLVPGTPRQLNHGDAVRFGQIKLTFYVS